MLRALRDAKTEGERQAILERINEVADDIGSTNVDLGQSPSSDPDARKFYAIATGALVQFTEHLDEWMATSHATAKTQDMQRSDVKRFAAKFAMVQDVTRPEVRRSAPEAAIADLADIEAIVTTNFEADLDLVH